jgi:hypothetical protein
LTSPNDSRFLTTAPFRARLLLFAAAFFAFSTLGFVVDALRPAVYPIAFTLLMAGGTGALAVAFVYSTVFNRRTLWLTVVAELGFLALVMLNEPAAQPLSAATADDIRVKLIVDGLGCFAGFLASYMAFMAFIGTEGSRYMRTHAEIELAGEIHRHLVPAVATTTDHFEFHGMSLPSQAVGGDLVDLVQMDRGWIGYVADVSGHGVGSGLLMGIVKSAIRTRLRQDATLDRLFTDVNPVVFDLSKPNMFVTLAAVQSDGTDRLIFSTAGHLPILHYSAASALVEELRIAQVPLGIFEASRFSSAVVATRRGDIYALVTDGFTEVFDANDAELGLDPLKETIRAHASRPLSEIAERIISLSRDYGVQQDDQTLLLIRARRSGDAVLRSA